MKRLDLLVAFVGILSLHANAAQAAPVNDSIFSATAIRTRTFAVQEDTRTATTDYDNDQWCFGYNKTVWFVLTPPETGRVTLSTVGSTYDTTLSVYTGSPSKLGKIDCVDDTDGSQEQLGLDVVQGRTYYVQVAAYSGRPTGGNLSFGVSFTPASWHDLVSLGSSIRDWPDCQYRGTILNCWARSAAGTLLWWSGPEDKLHLLDLGGSVGGPPRCVVRSPRIDCFAVDAKARLVQITYDGSAWGKWITVGGAVGGQPSCQAIGTSRIDCYLTGTDKGLYRFSFNGTWAPVRRVGTQVIAARPQCVGGSGYTDCFVVDDVGTPRVVRITSTGSAGPFAMIGPKLFAEAPQCIKHGTALDCFGRTKASQLIVGSFDGSAWGFWSSPANGGALEAGPTCMLRNAAGTPDVDCFSTTPAPANSLVMRRRVGGVWQRALSLGGSLKGPPVCVTLSGMTNCFVRGTDNALKQKSFH